MEIPRQPTDCRRRLAEMFRLRIVLRSPKSTGIIRQSGRTILKPVYVGGILAVYDDNSSTSVPALPGRHGVGNDVQCRRSSERVRSSGRVRCSVPAT